MTDSLATPLATAAIGQTDVRIARLGLGTAALGGLFEHVEEDDAVRVARHALELGIRYIDTAPLYGHGKAERFLGRALEGIRRQTFSISTKVGNMLQPVDAPPKSLFKNLPCLDAVKDFSRDGILRSFDESLQRLKLDRIDIVYVHDPYDMHDQVLDLVFPLLESLRSQGLIGAIGVGINHNEPLIRFAREGQFDCFLLNGRYTLLEHSGLEELLPLCEQKQIGVILGGPYNSGILASDLSSGAKFFYQDAELDVLQRARQIQAVCEQFGVPLKAAALQFGLGHPAVVSVIPGARSLQEVAENFRMLHVRIPAELWQQLREQGLIPSDAPTPSS